MLFKRYLSEGLAHYSYLVGDQGRAAVIDPRRDIDQYLQDAEMDGCQVDLVLETHRNEDYLVGSCELEAATGADIFHADGQWAYGYGTAVRDGQVWQVGRLKIRAIHTPGHTPGSMSYLLHDPEGAPWMLFTGDTLFSGDAGRVDLLGEDRLEEMAGLLYESIFNQILPLGEGIILCPAHGSGSVCGGEIAERTWTTIGLEKQLNRLLQVGSKTEFIERHARMLERPPYFRNMERLNLAGPDVLHSLPILTPLKPGVFADAAATAQIVDTRDQTSFGAAHLAGSLSIWKSILPNFAGWFLDDGTPILLVCNDQDREPLVRMLVRMGFDNLAGYLHGGVLGWALAGKNLAAIATPDPVGFFELMSAEQQPFILDVRGEDEIKGGGLQHGKRIHLTELLDHLDEIPKNRKVATLCTSGYRSMLAASLLERAGWQDLAVPVGGLGAWHANQFGLEL